ncbi:MAG: hypothetical protein CMN02_05270 [Roseibacillus sp.]|nr:hypothetical protein [Roseibacillus sp.]
MRSTALISIVQSQYSIYINAMERLVIDLALLPEDGQLLEDELSSAIFDLPENDAKPLGPLFFSLQVQRFGDELLLQGNLRAPFEFLCVRTLTAFKKTIDLPETTIALEIGTRGEIDATEALREEILLNFPAYPRCDEGDEPVKCEINPRYLAVDKATTDDVDDPPAAEGDSRWAALDELENSDK